MAHRLSMFVVVLVLIPHQGLCLSKPVPHELHSSPRTFLNLSGADFCPASDQPNVDICPPGDSCAGSLSAKMDYDDVAAKDIGPPLDDASPSKETVSDIWSLNEAPDMCPNQGFLFEDWRGVCPLDRGPATDIDSSTAVVDEHDPVVVPPPDNAPLPAPEPPRPEPSEAEAEGEPDHISLDEFRDQILAPEADENDTSDEVNNTENLSPVPARPRAVSGTEGSQKSDADNDDTLPGDTGASDGGSPPKDNASNESDDSSLDDDHATNPTPPPGGGDSGAAMESRALEPLPTPAEVEPEQLAARGHPTPAPSPSRRRFNFASADAGAAVLDSGRETKNTATILSDNSDKYMRVPCAEPDKFFVVQLSEDIVVDGIQFLNLEHYSSSIKGFQLLASEKYPTDHWVMLGEFEATSPAGPQYFKLDKPAWARILKVRIQSFFGSEYYLTLTHFAVHGSTIMESFKEDMEKAEEDVRGIKQGIAEKEKVRASREQNIQQPPAAAGDDDLVAAVPISDGDQLAVTDGTGGTTSRGSSPPPAIPSPPPRRDASTAPSTVPSASPSSSPNLSTERRSKPSSGGDALASSSLREVSPSPSSSPPSSASNSPSSTESSKGGDDPWLVGVVSPVEHMLSEDGAIGGTRRPGPPREFDSRMSPAITNLSSVVQNLFDDLSPARCPIPDESHLFPMSSNSPPSNIDETASTTGETAAASGETVTTAPSGHSPPSSPSQQATTPSGNDDDLVVVDSEGKVNAAWKGLSSKPTTQSIFRTLTERIKELEINQTVANRYMEKNSIEFVKFRKRISQSVAELSETLEALERSLDDTVRQTVSDELDVIQAERDAELMPVTQSPDPFAFPRSLGFNSASSSSQKANALSNPAAGGGGADGRWSFAFLLPTFVVAPVARNSSSANGCQRRQSKASSTHCGRSDAFDSDGVPLNSDGEDEDGCEEECVDDRYARSVSNVQLQNRFIMEQLEFMQMAVLVLGSMVVVLTLIQLGLFRLLWRFLCILHVCVTCRRASKSPRGRRSKKIRKSTPKVRDGDERKTQIDRQNGDGSELEAGDGSELETGARSELEAGGGATRGDGDTSATETYDDDGDSTSGTDCAGNASSARTGTNKSDTDIPIRSDAAGDSNLEHVGKSEHERSASKRESVAGERERERVRKRHRSAVVARVPHRRRHAHPTLASPLRIRRVPSAATALLNSDRRRHATEDAGARSGADSALSDTVARYYESATGDEMEAFWETDSDLDTPVISRRHSHSAPRPPITPLRAVSAPQHHTLPRARDTRHSLHSSPLSQRADLSSENYIEITHDQLDVGTPSSLPVNLSFHSVCTRCRHSWDGNGGGGGGMSCPHVCHSCGSSASPLAADSAGSSCVRTPTPSMSRLPGTMRHTSSPHMSRLFSRVVRPSIARAQTDVPAHPYSFPMHSGSTACAQCSPPPRGAQETASSMPTTPQSTLPHSRSRRHSSRLYPASIPRERPSGMRSRGVARARQPLLVPRRAQLLNKRSTISHTEVPRLVEESSYEAPSEEKRSRPAHAGRFLARVSSASHVRARSCENAKSNVSSHSAPQSPTNAMRKKRQSSDKMEKIRGRAGFEGDSDSEKPNPSPSTNRSSTSSPSESRSPSPSPTSSPSMATGFDVNSNLVQSSTSPLTVLDINANSSRFHMSTDYGSSLLKKPSLSKSETLPEKEIVHRESQSRGRETFPRGATHAVSNKGAKKSLRRRQRRNRARTRRASMPVVDISSASGDDGDRRRGRAGRDEQPEPAPAAAAVFEHHEMTRRRGIYAPLPSVLEEPAGAHHLSISATPIPKSASFTSLSQLSTFATAAGAGADAGATPAPTHRPMSRSVDSTSSERPSTMPRPRTKAPSRSAASAKGARTRTRSRNSKKKQQPQQHQQQQQQPVAKRKTPPRARFSNMNPFRLLESTLSPPAAAGRGG